MTDMELVSSLIEKARVAQREFEQYSQEQVDEVVRAIGKAVYDNAEPLARLAVDETRMGIYEDKIMKNKGKTKMTWYRLKGVKSVAILRYLDNGIVEVAKPIGVIGAITPCTNPTMTPVHNAMIALKGRNAMVVCPHPRGKISGAKTVEVMREALRALGAPVDLLQIIENPTMEASALLTKLSDVCVSTGGPGMVKVAYSSGKPAFGVGAGNCQCLVDRDAKPEEFIPKVLRGRTYDCGMLCTCEQNVIVPREMEKACIEGFVEKGCYYVEKDEEIAALRDACFTNGVVNKDAVGQTAAVIAKKAGLPVTDVKAILVKTHGCGAQEIFSREKMFPVLAVYPYDTWEEAVEIAKANLEVDGKGHSIVVHSNQKEHIEYAAENICVSRVLVNQIGSSGLGGGFDNGLNPTATLGCGSWGNNSISENLWFHHLINVIRIAYRDPKAPIPTDEEIWA